MIINVNGGYSSAAILVSRASPFTREEGSGTAPLLDLFFSPEILGDIMNMQILWPQHDRYTQARTTTVLTWLGRQA